MLDIVSVGSSSSGNSYIIRAAGRTVILDVGLAAKNIAEALESTGTSPEDVDAVLVTHEHSDHVKSVRAISRKCCNAVFYTSRGTAEHTESFRYVPDERLKLISAGDSVTVPVWGTDAEAPSDDDAAGSAAVRIAAFALSHDAAEPLGYTVAAGGEKLAVVTDTGTVTDEIFEAVRDADLLVFESNHDEQMLMFGEYPYPLKMRIKSDHGHLSNEYAGDVLVRILEDRRRRMDASPQSGTSGPLRILLAHLSFRNNAPFFARQAAEDALTKAGFESGRDYVLDVASKEGLTYMP